MRQEAESHGPIRYLINTENHVDHIFGNYWFRGAGEIVNHKALWDIFMDPKAALDPFDYALEAIPSDDPEGAALLPDRDAYYADLPRGTVVFTGDLTLKVGDHTIHCLWTPGHTPGQLAVHVPEERVVFTGDTIFSGCQTWLMTSNVDQWIEALERIRALPDVDHLVPGHGPVVTLDYVNTQRQVLLQWKGAVAEAVAKGWTREETIERVRFDDDVRPGRRRAGLHDGSHPEQQRRVALGQAHRAELRQGPLTRRRLRPRRHPPRRPRRRRAELPRTGSTAPGRAASAGQPG